MGEKRSLGFVVKSLNHAIVRKAMNEAEKEQLKEVPRMHCWIIGYLYENQGKDIFQKDLEPQFHVARSTITSIVKQMEKNGYIIRESVDYDSRLKKLTLTEKGIERHEKIVSGIDRVEERTIEGIDPADLEVFYRVADQVMKNLDQGDCARCSCLPESEEMKSEAGLSSEETYV